jgi:tRNA (mo5U34)-methyltransferase
VTALDHFVWSLDTEAMARYMRECAERGTTPLPYETVPELWHPDTLPGKRGFDLAKRTLNSSVRDIVADYMTVDLDTLGSFDIALFMGVLYHMKNPFEALTRLARITRQLAVIETHAIYLPGAESVALCEFYEGSELGADIGNWWGPNEKAVIGMCRAAGFREVRPLSPLPIQAERRFSIKRRGAKLKPTHYRALFHALK